jgi:hypothetical protein
VWAPGDASASRRQRLHSSGGWLLAALRTVRHWIKNRELKGHKFGTRIGYRIRLGDDEDFLSRRATTGAISRLLLGGLPSPQGNL